MSKTNTQMVDMIHDEDALFLIDGSGFIFRAYHALPPMTRSDGTPVNAVLGFTNILVKMILDMQVKNIAVIFDAKRENYRNDIYELYKANRDETPEDLKPQFAIIKEATKAFSLPAIEVEGYEADDIIATYAKQAKEQGRKTVIVSSDKDLMQLVNDDVVMFDPMKNLYMGEEEVINKFGVPPNKVVDVQSLAGDSVDNVPGVPGIGVKTAALLINEYGDLDTLLERASEVKQNKRRENLIEFADQARISRELVRLHDHVELGMSIDDLELHNPDYDKLIEFLKKQEFRTTIARLERSLAGRGLLKTEEEEEPEYELVQDIEALQKWIDRAYETGQVAIDTETTGLTPAKEKLVGISLSTAKGNGCYIPLQHIDPNADLSNGFNFDDAETTQTNEDLIQIPIIQALELLKPVLEDPSVLKIGQNMKFDMQMFYPYDINISPIDDTMLLSYVNDGTKHGHGMDELSEMFCGHTPIPFKEICGSGKSQITFDKVPLDKALNYAAEDADITLRLHQILKPRLAQEKNASVYEYLDRPLSAVLAKMEYRGIRINPAYLNELGQEFGKKILELEGLIHKDAGHKFNIASPKQLSEILFDQMGLEGGKKTKTGAWSTNAKVLEELATQHDIVKNVLEYRQVAKLKSTYTDALVLAMDKKDNRVHSSFSMAVVSTGRLSSSDPNLQNIPIRSDSGKKIRRAFIPADGHKLLAADYSQVELRLAAEMAGIKSLQESFANDEDIHKLTAAQVFSVPLDEVTAEQRYNAKAINFGIIYGISGFGLSKQLNIPIGDASQYVKAYLDRFPELAIFMEAQKEYARQHGFVKTAYGRKCTIRGIKDKMPTVRNSAERQAINAPLQGTAADIIKLAMIKIDAELENSHLNAKMLLQVHDELLLEVPIDEMEETKAMVVKIMESVAKDKIKVPLKVDANYGDNWAEAH